MARAAICALFLLITFSSLVTSQKIRTIKTFYTPLNYEVSGAAVLPINQSVLLLSSGNNISILDDRTFYDIYESSERLLSFVIDPKCSIILENCIIYVHTVVSSSRGSTHLIRSLILRRDSHRLYIAHHDTKNIYTHTTPETSVSSGMISIDKKSNYLLFDAHNQILRISLLGCNPYCIPDGNPFGNATFSIGINSMRHCSFDGASSRLVCVDQGSACGDSIYIIYPRADYGYPGMNCGICQEACVYPRYYEFPVATRHGVGRSESGYVYRGTRTKNSYFNRYILLADNKLWRSPSSLSRNVVAVMEEIPMIVRPMNYTMTHMFQDASNELYLMGNNGTENGVFVFTLY